MMKERGLSNRKQRTETETLAGEEKTKWRKGINEDDRGERKSMSQRQLKVEREIGGTQKSRREGEVKLRSKIVENAR